MCQDRIKIAHTLTILSMNMKLLVNIYLISLVLMAPGCIDGGTDAPDVTGNDAPTDPAMDHRQQMRNFVINISTYSKQKNPDFMIIPQN